ncbi:MAG: AsmA-like C-terminal region-containing protein [Verrucomicrobiota bacterium]
MPDTLGRRIWTSARRIFRFFRIAFLLLVLGLAGFLLYISQAGLPDFLKNRILEQLRTHGMEVEYQKIRFRWDRGVVAENVAFRHAQRVNGPQMTLDELVVGLNAEALLHGRLEVEKLQFRGGCLNWHFAGPQPSHPLAITNLSASLWLGKDDRWDLSFLKGRFHGVDITVTGRLDHASRLRASPATNGAARPPALQPDALLLKFAHTLTNWQFQAPPQITLQFKADANAWSNLQGSVNLIARDAQTPYGRLSDATLAVSLQSATNSAQTELSLRLSAGLADTVWGRARQVQLRAEAGLFRFGDAPVCRSLHVTCDALDTKWCRGERVSVEADLQSTATNLVIEAQKLYSAWASLERAKIIARMTPAPPPAARINLEAEVEAGAALFPKFGSVADGRYQLQCLLAALDQCPETMAMKASVSRLQTPWGQAKTAAVQMDLSRLGTNLVKHADASWGAWEKLEGWPAHWTLDLQGVEAFKLALDRVQMEGNWRGPVLALDRWQAQLNGGALTVTGRLDVATREVRIGARSDFDARKLSPVMEPAIRQFLEQITWSKPPVLNLQARAVLPPWDWPETNWAAAVWPTLSLAGDARAAGVVYGGIMLSEARTRATFTNGVWRVPAFYARSADDEMWISGESDLNRKTFHAQVKSALDPRIIAPVLNTNITQVFDWFQWNGHPLVDADVTGRWQPDFDLTGTGTVRATNFVMRGVPISRLESRVQYRDKILSFINPLAERPGERADADLVMVDFNTLMLHLTNAHGSMEPAAVTKCIGPQTFEVIEAYQFKHPPRALVEGVIPLNDKGVADVKFTVSGGPFHWWRFNPSQVAGTVWWLGDKLLITNLVADFYGGRLEGNLQFDLAAKGTDYALQATLQEVQFNAFMADVNQASNKLDGVLSAELNVTHANAADWQSWQGFGQATLRNGLLWDMPIFGVFSQIMNGLTSGLGNSRATAATASFTITNSVVTSRDLQISANPFRMRYRGTVDFEGRVNARVEAEWLKDANVVGALLNLVIKPFSKIFVYKVTGSLNDPKTEALYLGPLLHPLQTIRKLVLPDLDAPGTDTPPSPDK